jgi:hypothetical protein
MRGSNEPRPAGGSGAVRGAGGVLCLLTRPAGRFASPGHVRAVRAGMGPRTARVIPRRPAPAGGRSRSRIPGARNQPPPRSAPDPQTGTRSSPPPTACCQERAGSSWRHLRWRPAGRSSRDRAVTSSRRPKSLRDASAAAAAFAFCASRNRLLRLNISRPRGDRARWATGSPTQGPSRLVKALRWSRACHITQCDTAAPLFPRTHAGGTKIDRGVTVDPGHSHGDSPLLVDYLPCRVVGGPGWWRCAAAGGCLAHAVTSPGQMIASGSSLSKSMAPWPRMSLNLPGVTSETCLRLPGSA